MVRLPRTTLRRGPREAESLNGTAPEAQTPRVDILEQDGLRWISIGEPRQTERAWLEENFDFHPLDYEDVYSRNQRPKVDEYPDYLFVVMHFPAFDKRAGRLNAAELDMFVGPDFIITIQNQSLQPLEYLFEQCRHNEQLREELFTKGAGYLLYRIVDSCVDASFPMLRKVGLKLERLEESIFEEEAHAAVVRDISNVKQEIINFRKIVRPQRVAVKDLERTKRYLSGELDIYFDDINDASERIWDMLENFKEVIEALEATNEAVLSHKLNDILRVLTAFSVIMLPMTLIASIMGMNVHVPGQGDIEGFWVVMGVILAVLLGMVTWFRRRGWL
ncbi:MAG TPA: magnesium transporter CorA family protein [Baekduia sp.]|nr:magnesium transporter CorA family protein [Baekduia sp.]